MNTGEHIRQTAREEQVSPALVFKEQVQWVILDYLFKKGLFAHLVFQGGTAIRLVYQGVRYSEDLDFVLKQKDRAFFDGIEAQLAALPAHVEKHLPMIGGAQLKTQRSAGILQRFALIIEADFLNAKDKTNIEIADVPCYEPRTLLLRHEALSMAPAVAVESAREILSDKIIAFAARPYIKGRDLWDVFFITDTLKESADAKVLSMVESKIQDYGLNRGEFPDRIRDKVQSLQPDGARILHEEMDRFLPEAYRTAFAPRYEEISKIVRKIYLQAAEAL